MNISRQHFQHLMDTVVAEQFPDSKAVYDFEKEDLIDGLYHPKEELRSRDLGVNKMADFGDIAEYVKVISTTFHTFLKIISWFKEQRKSKEELKKEAMQYWKESMVKEGINADKAELICLKYQEKFFQLVD
ncbi:MAG: hypothetical protein ACFB10_18060 [Salibacteraceae bacterium]